MKILLVNTSENKGGAAIAANRLTEALRKSGIDAEMMVMHKDSDQEHVIEVGSKWRKQWNFLSERFLIWTYNQFDREHLFKVSIASTGFDITTRPEFRDADLIHLQWINQGMLSLKQLKRILHSGKPVIWTMHDMWECTAICHHAYQCERFKETCHDCPFLRHPGKNDLSAQIFRKKQKLFASADLHIVTVSSWLKEQVKQSTLLGDKEVSVIPNTLSVEDFIPRDQAQSRMMLGLPNDKRIILFGAARVDDPIKGLPILIESIGHLVQKKRISKENLHLVLFGDIKDPNILSRIPIGYTYLGPIKGNEKLSRLYSSADVTVSASYYETFGQTLIEALSCGCLPVAFGNSGQRDIIIHKQNGYLADYLSPQSMAEGILWAFEHSQNGKAERHEQAALKYAAPVVAEAYLELYKKLTKK